MRVAFTVLAVALVFAFPAAAEAASRSSAHSLRDLPLRAGPGLRYAVVDNLPAGLPVRLDRCTRDSRWCLVLIDGNAAGWVRGDTLAGAGAKLEVTPHEFLGFDPLDPIPDRAFRPRFNQ